MLFNLYKYEFRKFKKEIIIFSVLALILNIYSGFKVLSGANVMMGINANILLLLATFMGPISLANMKLISQEHKDNTIYLMKSLPVSSKKSFLSKHLACISVYILSSIFVILLMIIQIFIAHKIDSSFFNFNMDEISNIIPNIKAYEAITIIGMIYISSIVMFFTNINVIFSASIIGKSFKKFSKLISFSSLVFIVYLIDKFGKVINNLNIFNSSTLDQNFILYTVSFDLIFLGISAILFFGTCTIYDKKIEF